MERLAADAMDRPGSLRSLSSLSAETDIPPAVLAQVVHRLRRAGLLSARRGPSGGVRLAKRPAEVPVLDVIRVFDGAGVGGRCVLGFLECADTTPCPAHPVWKIARSALERQLEDRSLADLAGSVEKKRAAALRGAAGHRARSSDRAGSSYRGA
jgi:Rrf2 family iron-sulfur cluster assembly transcriptional regulator